MKTTQMEPLVMEQTAMEPMKLHRKKILVVDDDPDVRLALQVRLASNDYQVIMAADGMASIAEARKHLPDLMILDLGLPAGDGFSVLERLKVNPRLASIPVIVLSARDRVDNWDRAIKAGAMTFLQKPVSNDKLQAVIRLILAGNDHDGQPACASIGPGLEQ